LGNPYAPGVNKPILPKDTRDQGKTRVNWDVTTVYQVGPPRVWRKQVNFGGWFKLEYGKTSAAWRNTTLVTRGAFPESPWRGITVTLQSN
jgi:hypothetical protein